MLGAGDGGLVGAVETLRAWETGLAEARGISRRLTLVQERGHIYIYIISNIVVIHGAYG